MVTANQPDKKIGEATTTACAISRNRRVLFFIDGLDSDFHGYMQFAALQGVNSHYVGIDQLISTREQVFDSLEACNETYEALVLDLDLENAPATPVQATPHAWSWATLSAPLTYESPWHLSECLPPPELSWTEIPELYVSVGSQVLRDLRSRIDRLRGLVRYLTGRIGVLIRRVERPHFDCTFVGLQKSFHLLHGAHPPRYRAGLSSGRRSNLSGGCVQAISSNPV